MLIKRRAALMLGPALVARAASAQTLPPVTIAVSSASLPGGVARITREMGLFEKHGVNARTPVMDNSSIASSALISGSVEFTTSAGTEVVVAQTRGQNEVAVQRLYGGFAAVVVLSKAVAERLGVAADAPVSSRLKALDGLVIAAPTATSSYTLSLRPAAEAYGAKIRFTYLAMAAMVSALESGAVQGFISSSPFYALSVLKGTGVIWINGPKGEFPAAFTPGSIENLNAMRGFAESHPELLARVIAAFEEFMTSLRASPDAVKAAIARLFPELDAKTLDFLFGIESPAFVVRPLTTEDMTREIAFMKLSNLQSAGIERLDPAALKFP